jgi:anaphase-promoting complex subunit 8
MGAQPPPATPPEEHLVDTAASDLLLLASSYFEAKEYLRCVHALQHCSGPRAVFLKLYARYLAGESRREEDRIEAAGPLGRSTSRNKELEEIEREAKACRLAHGPDAFVLYMEGMAMCDMGKKEAAARTLCEVRELKKRRQLHYYTPGRRSSTPLCIPSLFPSNFST